MWEQQAVMAKLGTTEEAAKLRAKMQSSSLMSDMQAFKVRGLTAHYTPHLPSYTLY